MNYDKMSQALRITHDKNIMKQKVPREALYTYKFDFHAHADLPRLDPSISSSYKYAIVAVMDFSGLS